MGWIARTVGTTLAGAAVLGGCGAVGDGPTRRDYAEVIDGMQPHLREVTIDDVDRAQGSWRAVRGRAVVDRDLYTRLPDDELRTLCSVDPAQVRAAGGDDVYIRRAVRAGDPAEVSGQIVLKRAEPGQEDPVSSGGWTWAASGIEFRAGGVSSTYLSPRDGYDSFGTVVDVTDEPERACTRIDRLLRSARR